MSVFLALLLVSPVSAQNSNETSINSDVSAGITPKSPFFFLDRFGEELRQAFTFKAEAKVRLEARQAEERIAEIRELSLRGDAEDAIVRAQGLITQNVIKAETILVEHESEIALEVKEELAITFSSQQERVEGLLNDSLDEATEFEFEFEQAFEDEMEIEIEHSIDLSDHINLLDDESDEDEGGDSVDRGPNEQAVLRDMRHAAQRIAQAEVEEIKAVERINKEELRGRTVEGALVLFTQAENLLQGARTMFEAGDYVASEELAHEAKNIFNDAREGRNFNEPDEDDRDDDDRHDEDEEDEDDSDDDDEDEDEEDEEDDDDDDDSDDD